LRLMFGTLTARPVKLLLVRRDTAAEPQAPGVRANRSARDSHTVSTTARSPLNIAADRSVVVNDV
jgi:hypothetical protein